MADTKKSEGVSMLSAMASGFMDTKVTKAKGLTPLRGETILNSEPEAATSIPNHPVLGSLPDDPDIILGRLRDARREVVAILESIDRLERAWGKPEEVLAEQTEGDKKAIEKEADRQHADRVLAGKEPAKDKAELERIKAAAARVADAPPVEAVEAKVTRRVNAKAEALANMIDPAVAAFAADIDAKSEALKAQVFGAAVADSTVEGGEDPTPTPATAPAPADGEWTCPIHGEAIIKVSPRRGAKFHACPRDDCREFEKL